MPLVFRKARTSPLASAELTASEKRMMGYLIRAWDQQKQHLLEQEGLLIDALIHGPESRVLALIDDMPLLQAQEQINNELRYEAIASAERTRIPGIRLRKLKEPFVLDLTEPRRQSADWARKKAGTLITEITTDQRESVRQIIADAEQIGISPRDTARRLRDVVGITSRQAGWVSNYRDRILADGLARGLPAARAEQRAQTMGDRYARRVHTYRAETIARTEIAFASHQGRREVWAAALAEGYITVFWRQKWVTNEDGRECEECAALNGTTVQLNQDFPEGDPPLHPNCRCDVQLLEEEDAAPVPTLETTPETGATYDEILARATELKKLADDADPDIPNDPALAEIYRMRDYDGLPQVIDADEIDSLAAQGAQVFWRGLTESRFIDDLRSGEYWAGRGVYGNGTYSSTDVGTSLVYANRDPDNLVRFTLAPDTRIAVQADLKREHTQARSNRMQYWNELDAEIDEMMMVEGITGEELRRLSEQRRRNFNQEMAERWVLDDFGRWAAMMGYDAVRVDFQGSQEIYMVVLNRRKMIIQSTNGGSPNDPFEQP